MAKRKQPMETEKENRVNQVVEVVEEPVKEETQEQPVVEDVVEQVETPVEEKEEEKQKEVVADLFQPEISEVKNGSGKKLFIWAAIVVGVSILVGGVLIAATGGALPFTARPTPTPAPTPTSIPVASLDRKDLSILVLNGGGTPGAGGKMKTFLEEKGYTVSRVGNTDEYTYEQTEILVKRNKEAYINLLTKDLESDYTIGTTAATLGDDESADAQVIVGKK